jgi:C4-dicarboxylate transporter
MKKIAIILALALPSATGMALTSAFALGLLPVLSNDACYIAKVGITHFVANLPSHFHRRIAA